LILVLWLAICLNPVDFGGTGFAVHGWMPAMGQRAEPAETRAIRTWRQRALALTGMRPAWAGPPALRTLTDPAGRQMQVPLDPRRVVALAPSVTEIVFALGQQARLQGVSRFSDYPPAAADFPKVGSYVHLDVERIVALRPDLCIGIKDGNPLAVVEQLEQIGIPVFAVNPVDMETAMRSIEAVGGLLNAPEKARAIVADMRRRIRRVAEISARAEHRPRVFVQIGISPIVSVGNSTFINELITLAGGINVAAGPNPYPRFSVEQVIALAPDVLVISSMARATVFEKVKEEWMQWPAIPAVRNQAVYIAPTNIFDRPTPRLVDGLEQMARYIHPSLFKE
jgi:iron complex transport system substrate-binding protein